MDGHFVTVKDVKDLDIKQLVALMVGRELQEIIQNQSKLLMR